MTSSRTIALLLISAASALLCAGRAAAAADAEAQLRQRIDRADGYALVPPDLFERLGWVLPDGGRRVKALAEAAPGGAFDPRALEKIPSADLGYSATWHVVRYRHYGLEWDITGLLLSPRRPVPGLPTVAFINGGSANWYEFFVDPLNGPAVAQYLAQKLPVLLVTIPGNYRPGGWTEPISARRPAYLLDRDLDEAETKVRNAVFTFAVVTEGVQRLVERATRGRVLIAGHSTGGEVQFLLKDRLKDRLAGLSLGWGTGGPARIRRTWSDEAASARNTGERKREYPPLAVLRPRTPEEYARSYVGPLNSLGPGSGLEVARRWFEREQRRRPQFKQVLQDLEHTGASERHSDVEREIRELLAGSTLRVDADDVVRDLFSTLRAPLTGYRKMIWTTAMGDDGHWDPDPERARELFVAKTFKTANPDAAIRVLVFDVPMSHYGHIEKPRQLAGGLLAAVKWLYEGGDSRR
jgi:hypothetical protein